MISNLSCHIIMHVELYRFSRRLWVCLEIFNPMFVVAWEIIPTMGWLYRCMYCSQVYVESSLSVHIRLFSCTNCDFCPGGVRAGIAKHHWRCSKSDHLCHEGVEWTSRRKLPFNTMRRFNRPFARDDCTRWRLGLLLFISLARSAKVRY